MSLAPLAFATFTAIFAARSGARASSADAWITGVVTGSVVFTALGTLVALTSHTAVAEAQLWQAVLFPALLFAVPALLGAVVTEWRDAGRGMIARLRDRTEALPGGWAPVPGITVRASAAAIAGLIGLGALALGVAVLMGAGQIVALYQAGNFDLLGAIVVTLTQFAYLPTFVVWGLSFVAGPGFALGAGTAVSPAGTQLGVVPGVPVLGRRAGVDDDLAPAAGAPADRRRSPRRVDRPVAVRRHGATARPAPRPGRAVAVRGRSDGVPGRDRGAG